MMSMMKFMQCSSIAATVLKLLPRTPSICEKCTSLLKSSTQSLASSFVVQRRQYASRQYGGGGVARKPLNYDNSGDLVTREPLDDNETLELFKGLKELENAPEEVKRLFTIRFSTGRERQEHRKWKIQDRMDQVCGVDNCWEKSIANMTVKIRDMIPHMYQFKKDKKNKSYLNERIQMRRKLLKYLRHADYDRFIWLLKELQIQYVAVPEYRTPTSYRAQKKAAARQEAYEMKTARLEELKARLAKEREEFYKAKDAIMAEIEADIEKYELDKKKILKQVETERKEELD